MTGSDRADLPPTIPDPPAPPGRSVWRSFQTWRWLRRDLTGFFIHLAQTNGDVASCSLGPHRFVLLSHPDVVRDVLVRYSDNFSKTKRFLRLRKVMGDGLLTSSGERHLEDRRRYGPAFAPERIAAVCPDVVEEARRLAASWSEGSVVDVLPAMIDLTLSVALRCLFGTHDGIDRTALAGAVRLSPEILRRIVDPLGPLHGSIPGPTTLRLRKAVRTIRNFGKQMTAISNDGSQRKDALLSSTLLREAGTGGNADRVTDHAVTFLLTGHETTAIALTWALFLLARHPDVQDAVREECHRHLGTRPFTMDAAERLPTLIGVIAESLRLYPPIYAISRSALKTTTIGGFRIDAGTTVYMNVFGIHRDPRVYPDPESFRPERWKGRAPHEHRSMNFLPFGAGGRSCIGMEFAWMEMMAVLSTFVRSRSFQLVTNRDPGLAPTITLRPRDPIKVTATTPG